MSSMSNKNSLIIDVSEVLCWASCYRKDIVISGGAFNSVFKTMTKQYLPRSCVALSEDKSGDIICDVTKVRDFLGVEIADVLISFLEIDTVKDFKHYLNLIKDSVKVVGLLIVCSEKLNDDDLTILFSDMRKVACRKGGFIALTKSSRYDPKKQNYPVKLEG